MSIDKAIEQYLLWKATHTKVAPKRYRPRLEHFNAFINQDGQNRELASISGDDIIQYHHKMANENIYSDKTIAYSSSILKDFFKFWHGRNEAKLNPMEIKPMKCVSGLRPVVKKGEFEAMCECLDRYVFADLTRLLTIHLLWDTGMRVSELCDIKLEDIEGPNEDGLRYCKVRTRKSMRYNLVAWGKETNDLLCSYLGVRLCLCPQSPYLLIGPERPSDKRVNPRTIQKWIREICERSMLAEQFTPHSFRHGKAHHMLDNGANVRDVQAILRHVNPVNSFQYMTLNPTRYLETAAKFV